MSDSDRDSAACRRPPSAYFSTRPAQGSVGRPHSLYVGMADGCQLAVDVYLPPDASGRVPAILIFIPYYRRFALRAFAPQESAASLGITR
jgi:predicted acyl esterase